MITGVILFCLYLAGAAANLDWVWFVPWFVGIGVVDRFFLTLAVVLIFVLEIYTCFEYICRRW